MATDVKAASAPVAPAVANAVNYAFTTSANGSLVDMSSGTTQLIGPNCVNCPSEVTSIGFDFYFLGTRATQFSVNSNGLLRFGNGRAPNFDPHQPLGLANHLLITPYGAYQRTHTTGKIHFKLTGAAPNRVLVIEWLNLQSHPHPGGTADLTYQLLLHETTGVFQFIYGHAAQTPIGAVSPNSKNPHIGFSASNSTTFIGAVEALQGFVSVDYSANTLLTNIYESAGPILSLNSDAQGARRVMTFTPPVLPPPTGLTFTNVTPGAMTLNWTNSVAGETGYAIFKSADGVDFEFVAVVAENSATFTVSGLQPATNYHWRVVSVSEGALGAALAGTQATVTPTNIVSTAAGGLWNNPATWVGGVVPGAGNNVTIADGATVTVNNISVTNPPVNCFNLTVGTGGGPTATVIYDPGSVNNFILNVGGSALINGNGVIAAPASGTRTTHVLSIGADLTNNGALDLSANGNATGVILSFTGMGDNTFGGTGATNDLRTLQVAKTPTGASLPTPILTINPSALTVRGSNDDAVSGAGFFSFGLGILRFSGTFTLNNRLHTTAAYTISAAAGLWIDNPNFTVTGQNGSAVNNGFLRLTQGVYNVGAASGNSMTGNGVYLIEGGALNVAGRLTATGAADYRQIGGTVTVATVGNTASNSPSFGFTGSGATTRGRFTMSGGVIILQNRSTGAPQLDYSQNAIPSITGGLLQIGNANTPANSAFVLAGATPSLTIDNSTAGRQANYGVLFVTGDVTVNPDTTLNRNANGELQLGSHPNAPGNLINNGAVTGVGTNQQALIFGTGFQVPNDAQTISGSGAFGTAATPFPGFGIANAAGVTLNQAAFASRLNLFFGTLNNSHLLTLGNGPAGILSTVQRGNASNFGFPAGVFDVTPIFNVAANTHSAIYAEASTPTLTSIEIPPERSLRELTINQSRQVTIAGGPLVVTNTLFLLNGLLNTDDANLLTITNTAGSSGVSGGSATSFVKGPVARVFPASATGGGNFLFPVGKTAFTSFTANPSTNAGGTVTVKVEVFETNSGGAPGTNLCALNTDRFWRADITNGAANFIQSFVSLTNVAPVFGGYRVGRAPTQNGVYDAFNATSVNGLLVSSGSAFTGGLGFFAIGYPCLAPGSYTVGAGGHFPNLDTAFNRLNTTGLDGPTTLLLTDPLYMQATSLSLMFNPSHDPSRPLTIRPADGVAATISGATTSSCLVNLIQARHVTFDGVNAGGASLTIRNDGASGAIGAFCFFNDSSDNTLQNAIIEIGNASTANATVGVLVSDGLAGGTGCDHNTIRRNTIRGRAGTAFVPTFPIALAGLSEDISTDNTVIADNIIRDFDSNTAISQGVGIKADDDEGGISNTVITGNDIAFTALRTMEEAIGILVRSRGVNTVSRNRIHDLSSDSDFFTAIDLRSIETGVVEGNHVFNIGLDPAASGSVSGLSVFPDFADTLHNLKIANNQFALATNAAGVNSINGFSFVANSGEMLNVAHNSILIGGAATGISSSAACQLIGGANNAIQLRNNIFFNRRSGGTLGHYAIGDDATPDGTLLSDFNFLFGSGPAPDTNKFMSRGAMPNGTPLTLAEWRAGVNAPDLNSLDGVALGVNAANLFFNADAGLLHLKPGPQPVHNAGAFLASVPNDFDNQTRSAPPEIGADEIGLGVWSGAANTDWHNNANWNDGNLPALSDDTMIPATGVTNEPSVSAADVVLGSLALASNRTLTITANRNLTLATSLNLGGGNVVVNPGSSLHLTNCNPAALTGATATGYVRGALTRCADASGAFEFPVGTANGLSPVTITPTSGASSVTVAAQAPGRITGLDATNSINRFWDINSTATGGSFVANLSFTYQDADDDDYTGPLPVNRIVRRNDSLNNFSVFPANVNGMTLSVNDINQFSRWTLGGNPNTPTLARVARYEGYRLTGGNLLRWHTSFETKNLGFHVYRQEGPELTRLTPDLIAGSALKFGGATPLSAGFSYTWWDAGAAPGSVYWVEDYDLSGARQMHGPLRLQADCGLRPAVCQLAENLRPQSSQTLGELNEAPANSTFVRRYPAAAAQDSRAALPSSALGPPAPSSAPALKLSVNRDGWQRVDGAQLFAQGLPAGTDAALLQLYADGAQVPLAVRAQDGRDTGPLGASGVLEFYGQARDTRETDTRAYRLIVGDKPGLRIGPPARVAPGGDSGGKNATDTEPPATDSFSQTVERKDRSIYFAALDNGEERENFFGPVVNAAGAAQTLPVEQLDHTASYPARLEITLQGASDGPHRVRVSLNGQELGEVDFAGQQNRAARFEMPQSVLQEGDNQLSWQALGGAADVSLLDTARLTYARRYEATEGRLLLSTGARRHLRVSGFTTPNVRVFDVTEPRRVFQLAARVEADASGYTASLNSHLVNRLLLAVEDSRAHAPSRIVADEPSSWRDTNNAADFVILAPAAFRAAAEPLADARRAQGLLTVVVGLEDVYDEFSAGDADVNALRAFLRHAQTHWQRGPRYLLLLGDASLDPRNYLGLGARDYLPTGYVGTVFMETASDESLADLDGDGVAEIALGRLPASSPAQAQLQINKTLIYAPPASGRAVLVSDRPDGYDFASLNQTVRQQLPAGTPVTEIVRADDNATRQAVIAAFNQGPALVNYVGHGSVEVWTGAPIFNSADALALVNGPRLPLVVAMTCLNGYFQDLHTTSLAESLLNAPHGGAVAVWASSALTPADAQAPANRMFARSLYRDGARLGDAARAAKAAAPATDVRRTWILFGDPTLTAR